MQLRLAQPGDLTSMLELYTCLKTETPPEPERAQEVFGQILSRDGHYLIVGEEGGRIVTSCALTIVPNLTRQARPYAMIENVVTAPDMRGRGYATAALEYATEIARGQGCYKVMLMTGSKQLATLRFYEKAGFSAGDKTAFVMWL